MDHDDAQIDGLDRISKLQYKNLRDNFNKSLVEPILGEDYYNMGQCVYSCDANTVDDLSRKFEAIKQDKKFYAILATVSFFINIILILKIF